MLQGIGFITVIAASVTAALIETARKQSKGTDDSASVEQLERIQARLEELERAIGDKKPEDSG